MLVFAEFLLGFWFVCANQPRTNHEQTTNQKRTKNEPNTNQLEGPLLLHFCLVFAWFLVRVCEPTTNQPRTNHEPKTNQKLTKYEPTQGPVVASMLLGFCLVVGSCALINGGPRPYESTGPAVHIHLVRFYNVTSKRLSEDIHSASAMTRSYQSPHAWSWQLLAPNYFPATPLNRV